MNPTELIEDVSGKLTGFLNNWQTCTYYIPSRKEANLAYCADNFFDWVDLFKKAFNREKGEKQVMYIIHTDLDSVIDFKIKQNDSKISDIGEKINALDTEWKNKIFSRLFGIGKKDYMQKRKELEEDLKSYERCKEEKKEAMDALLEKYSEPYVISYIGKDTNSDFEGRDNHSRFTLVGDKKTTDKIIDYFKQYPEEITSIIRKIFDPDKCAYKLDGEEKEKYFDPFSLVKEINIFDYRTPSNNMILQKD